MRTHFARARRSLAAIGGTLVWAVAGAALLAPAGALFGIPFGAVVAWRHDQPSAFVPALLHCTLSAAAAGAILGGFIRLTDGHNPLAAGALKVTPATGNRKPLLQSRRRAIPGSRWGRVARLGSIGTWPPNDGKQDPSLN